jgi:hypothetical protein
MAIDPQLPFTHYPTPPPVMVIFAIADSSFETFSTNIPYFMDAYNNPYFLTENYF